MQRTKDTKEGRQLGRVEIDIYTPTILCIRQITNENLLYSTGNSTQCSVVTQKGRKSKRGNICIYAQLIHSAEQQRLTQHCKATIFQFLKRLPNPNDMVERQNACSAVSGSLKPQGLQHARLLCSCNLPGKHTGVGCHFLLQGTILAQGANPQLLTWRQVLYC